MPSERAYIVLCLRLIGEKYQLGNDGWKQREMEYVAKTIEDRSGVILSLSTIKRLLRNPDQTPQPATLNALVSVLEYSDWQEFKMRNRHFDQKSKRDFPVAPVLIGCVIAVLLAWLLISGFVKTPQSPAIEVKGEIVFNTNKTVLNGVPNTVVFEYDVKNVLADSFFIQQSWNELERTPIDPQGRYFTSIYYYPGFHRAKLIVNDSIILRKFIHITTDGWFPVVRYNSNDPVPVYIDRTYTGSEILTLGMDELEQSGVDMQRSFMLTYFNVRDFDGIHSDNFVLNTRLRSETIQNYPCPFAELLIMTEQHIFYIPLISKGCESNITLKIGERIIPGRTNDLSAFGCNLEEWQDLELKVIQKGAEIFLNSEKIYETSFTRDFGRIVGLSITFSGSGSVEYTGIESIK